MKKLLTLVLVLIAMSEMMSATSSDNYLLDSIVRIDESTGFVDSKKLYEYHENGTMQMSVNLRATWSSWKVGVPKILNSKTTLVYDEEGHELDYFSSVLDTATGIWKDTHHYLYDERHNRVCGVRKWNSDSTVVLQGSHYYYDEDNFQIGSDQFDTWNGVQVLDYKCENIKDAHGNKIIMVEYSKPESAWDGDYMSDPNTFNETGWVRIDSVFYTYNEKQEKTRETIYRWNNDTQEWTMDGYQIFEYDEEGHCIADTVFARDFETNVITYNNMTANTYDSHGKLSRIQMYIPNFTENGVEWIENGKYAYDYTYNENGEILQLRDYIDWQTGSSSTTYYTSTYFYSEHPAQDEPETCIFASGICGGDLTWELTCDSVLTIKGTGMMYEYSDWNSPWRPYKDSIKSVIIEEGVTTISTAAFRDHGHLQSCILPSTIESIGNEAFCFCFQLMYIEIPPSCTAFGDGSFNLVPNVIIQDESILPYSGSARSLNGYVDGLFVYDNSEKRSLRACSSAAKGEITLDDAIERIEYMAFAQCEDITHINFGSNLQYIGEWSLDGCRGLDGLQFQEGLTEIATHGFGNCFGLRYVSLPNSLTTLGDFAIGNCPDLRVIRLGDSLKYIGYQIFDYCQSIDTIYASMPTPPILDETAFAATDLSKVICLVPDQSVSLYKNALVWKEMNIRSIDAPEDPRSQYDSEEDIDITFDKYKIDNYVEQYGLLLVSAEQTINENDYLINLQLYVPEGTIELVPGTYPIVKEENIPGSIIEGTADGMYLYGSFLAKQNSTGGIEVPLWFIVDGNVIVSEDLNITVVARNTKGSIIHCDLFTTDPPAPDTITVAHALEIGSKLSYNETSDKTYAIIGYIIKIEDYNTQYNLITFWMADDNGIVEASNEAGAFYVWRGVPDVELEVGDRVCVTTKIINYKSTLKESQRGIVTLLEMRETYTVAGSSIVAFGKSWDPTNVSNDMVKSDNLYEWVREDLKLADGEIDFKISKDHAWTEAYPEQEYKLIIPETGIYTITITFNPNTKEVTALATKTGEAIVLPHIVLNGNFTGTWKDTAFVPAEDSLTATLTLEIDEGTYEFGFKFDGIWKSNGTNITRENNSTKLISTDAGFMHITADNVGEYRFIYTYESCELEVIYPEEPDVLVLIKIALPEENKPNNDVEIIGTFDGWEGTLMEYINDVGITPHYHALFNAKASDYFKFRSAGSWNQQIEIYDVEKDKWNTIQEGQFKFGDFWVNDTWKGEYVKYVELIWNDPDMYRWTCDGECVQWNLTVNSNPSIGGYVTGGGSYHNNSNVILTANPNYGYHFVQWSDGVTDNPRSFVLTQDTTFTAEFAANTSGQCGDNLVWELSDNVLSISGFGAMWDMYDVQPWVGSVSRIKKVNLPKGLTSIGSYAFKDFINLDSISIPSTVTSVGSRAFDNCTNITYFEGPLEAINNIWGNNLTTIIINRGSGDLTKHLMQRESLIHLDMAAIETSTFPKGYLNGLYNLEDLVLPAHLETIGYMSVAECIELKEIVIPASVVQIEKRAFEDCRSLTQIEFAEGCQLETIGDWAFYNCHELAQLEIPDGVTEIGKAAFYGCTYLKDVVLPASVQSLGDNAFALCAKMKRMEVNAVIPPTIEAKTFEDVSREMPVYVPDESVTLYKSDPLWKEMNIVGQHESPTGIDQINNDPSPVTHKILRDGQILILRGDKTYTITGQEIR